jgi:menaquinone-dependent protoporphyrinogen oxidase
MKVLVAYASKYGATQGIAERIGDVLGRRGLEADVVRCKDVDDATEYDAYVVGSAAYMFRWRKDARKFVHRNQDVLGLHPVWLFSSGPVGTDRLDAKGHDVLAGAEPREVAEFESTISPRGMQVFFGAFQLESSAASTGWQSGRPRRPCPWATSATGTRSKPGRARSPMSWARRPVVPERAPVGRYACASSSRMPATNASMSSSLVSNEHIQRTSPRAASQS